MLRAAALAALKVLPPRSSINGESHQWAMPPPHARNKSYASVFDF
jgi:hypothetical protein